MQAIRWDSSAPVDAWRSEAARAAGLAAIVVGLLVGPIAFIPLLMQAGGPLIVIPTQHFYIVSIVALLAAVLAGWLAVATVQIGLYRVLFMCLGFMALGLVFAVHGLTTPGILVPNLFKLYRGSAVGLSAFLSLFLAGAFFAAAYFPGMSRLERRLPFWPAGWIVVLVTISLLGYAGVAVFRTELIARLPLGTPPYSTGLATLGGLFFLFAASRQAWSYRSARLASQAGLVVAFLFLAEAQVAMALFKVWTWGWWEYHLLMLAGVAFALRALVVEMARGRSFRSVVEAALELEVSVGVEELDVDTVAALVAAVEIKDRETHGHNRRVAELAVKIGHELGFPAPELRVLARAGLLHDLGKLGIPDAILHKEGSLDEEEWKIIRTHPEIGMQILVRTGKKFQRELLAVLYHHERMDGSGYPHGLAGEAIPIEARIVAVADTYDVITSDRPYRKGRGRSAAVGIIEAESGKHLDAGVVKAFLRVLPPEPEARGEMIPAPA